MKLLKALALSLFLVSLILAQPTASDVATGFQTSSLLAQAVNPNPTFESYKPVFADDVFIVNETMKLMNYPGWQVKVNPSYALSEASALELLEVLKEYRPVLFHSGPFGWSGSGGFKASRLVPWLKFPDGSAVNAGLIANYWAHGFSLSWLTYCVKTDIAWMHQMALDKPEFFTWVLNYPRT